MKTKEKAFLQYYVSTGQNTQRKVECYKLAFGKDAEGVKDSSINTYAKRLLATSEAKEWLNAHRPSSEMRGEQLLDAIEDLNGLLLDNPKVSDQLSIRREIRLHLSDLAKCVEPINKSGESEFIVHEDFFTITSLIKTTDKVGMLDLLSTVADRPHTTILLCNNGQVQELLPIFRNESKDNAFALKEGLAAGEFGLAVRK